MSTGQPEKRDLTEDVAANGDDKAVMKDPTDTDHPTGEQQAKENRETESPS